MRQSFLCTMTMVLLCPAMSGFVLLSSNIATLDATADDPTVNFVWDGNTPEITEKGEYKEGAFANLEDKEFMEQLLTDSLNTWNEVPGSFIQLTVVEGEASLDPEDDQHSIIVQSSSNLTTAAFAAPSIPEEDKSTIADCDVSISDRSTTAKSLAYTLIHELGHCLGLGHAHTNYGAIMSYSRAARNLSLGADDMAGVIFLYPDPNYDSDEMKELISCGTIAYSERQFGIALVLLLAPFGLLFANRWYRRRPISAATRARSDDKSV